jgi:hypothetical protein
LGQEFRRGRGNWGAAISVFKHNKVTILSVNDHSACFLTHEESA